MLVRHIDKNPQKQSSIVPLFLGEVLLKFAGYSSSLLDTGNQWCLPMTLQLGFPRPEVASPKELITVMNYSLSEGIAIPDTFIAFLRTRNPTEQRTN